MLELLARFFIRIAPREGWLVWLLALALALLAALSASEAGWVPGIGATLAAVTAAAFLTGFALARLAGDRSDQPRGRRSLPGWLAVLLAAALGVTTAALVVGWGAAQSPPEGTPWSLLLPARGRLALVEMTQRLTQWVVDVRSGSVAQDDAVFLWILALVVWAAAVWAAWKLFHGGNALAAFLPVGLLLALNAYFFWAGRIWLPFFFGGITLLTVLVERFQAEQRWQRRQMDYSRDVRLELFYGGGMLVLLVTAASLLMVRVAVQPAANWFEALTAGPIASIEAAGESLFPGLRRQPGALLASGGGSGGLPRAFLLTGGPELGQQPVMRVATDELEALPAGEAPSAAMQHYWRALTYDLYTGNGWRNSPAQREQRRAGETWLEELPAGRRLLRQQVEMARGGDRAFFAAGEPLAFNRVYETLVRIGADDPWLELIAMTGSGRRYQVLSAVPALDEEALRAAGDAYPAAIAQRYLALPEIPQRVARLASQVVADAATPYDQALALQAYLRTFPYSLQVPPPPADRDVVDYFLFDLQAGYCDYYATAMVVMARSIGIPARLAVGYAAGQYDASQRAFVVTEDMAHSWPELFFPGAGWIPFEPTASRAVIPVSPPAGSPPVLAGDLAALAATDLEALRGDEHARGRAGWLAGLLVLLAVALLLWWADRRRPAPSLEAIYEAFGRWGRRLGRAAGVGETPGEFGGEVARLVSGEGASVGDFVQLYQEARYGPDGGVKEPLVRRRWQELRGRLRRVWLARKMRIK